MAQQASNGSRTNGHEPMALTYQQAVQFNAESKRSIRRLEWQPRPLKRSGQWYEAVSPLEVDGVIHQETRLVLAWRGAVGARLQKYSFTVLYLAERVYGLDFDPDGQHTNKVGIGRPYFMKRIGPGTHMHTPSQDSVSGYADPMQDFASLEEMFNFGRTACRLDVPGGFVPPPPEQMRLDL